MEGGGGNLRSVDGEEEKEEEQQGSRLEAVIQSKEGISVKSRLESKRPRSGRHETRPQGSE